MSSSSARLHCQTLALCLSACLPFSSDYFQPSSTSFCHLNCSKTRSFSHSALTRTQIFQLLCQNKPEHVLLFHPRLLFSHHHFHTSKICWTTLQTCSGWKHLDFTAWGLLKEIPSRGFFWGFFCYFYVYLRESTEADTDEPMRKLQHFSAMWRENLQPHFNLTFSLSETHLTHHFMPETLLSSHEAWLQLLSFDCQSVFRYNFRHLFESPFKLGLTEPVKPQTTAHTGTFEPHLLIDTDYHFILQNWLW